MGGVPESEVSEFLQSTKKFPYPVYEAPAQEVSLWEFGSIVEKASKVRYSEELVVPEECEQFTAVSTRRRTSLIAAIFGIVYCVILDNPCPSWECWHPTLPIAVPCDVWACGGSMRPYGSYQCPRPPKTEAQKKLDRERAARDAKWKVECEKKGKWFRYNSQNGDCKDTSVPSKPPQIIKRRERRRN